MRTIEHWIGGTTTSGTSTRTAPVWNPATGEHQAQVVLASRQDVDDAVAAASRPSTEWSQASLSQRAKVLFAFRELVNAHVGRAGRADHRRARQGPLRRRAARCSAASRSSSSPAASRTCSRATTPTRSRPASTSSRSASRSASSPASRRSTSRRWCRCGCTRSRSPAATPSSSSPASATRRRRMLRRRAVAARRACPTASSTSCTATRWPSTRCSTHPDVAAVSFVGSTPIAQLHPRDAPPRHGKRVQALGGAKNHAIVLPDADLDFAADHLAAAAFGSAGERCMAISRRRRRRRRPPTRWSRRSTERRTRGQGRLRPRRRRSEMGPVITPASQERIVGLIGTGDEAGRRHGASTAATWSCPGHEDGFFVGPTVIDHVTTEMDVYTEEIFGPVLSVRARRRPSTTAIALINANPYGNGTAIFTRAGEAARRFQRGVHGRHDRHQRAGPVPMAYYSFGGWKDSLFGDKHIHGPEGVLFYTRAKVVTARWPHVDHGPRRELPLPDVQLSRRDLEQEPPMTTDPRQAPATGPLTAPAPRHRPRLLGRLVPRRPAPGALAPFLDEVAAAGYTAGSSSGPTATCPPTPSSCATSSAAAACTLRRHRRAPRCTAAPTPRRRRSPTAGRGRRAARRDGRAVPGHCCPRMYTDLHTGALLEPAELTAEQWSDLSTGHVRARQASCRRSTASGWCSTRTPTPTSTTQRRDRRGSWSSPTPRPSRSAWTPGTSPTAAATTSAIVARHPDRIGYVHLKSGRPRRSLAKVRAEGMSFAEAVQLGAMVEPPPASPTMPPLLAALAALDVRPVRDRRAGPVPGEPDYPLPIATRTRTYLNSCGLGPAPRRCNPVRDRSTASRPLPRQKEGTMKPITSQAGHARGDGGRRGRARPRRLQRRRRPADQLRRGSGAAGGGGNSGYTFAMITHETPGDTFWDRIKAGAEQAAKDTGSTLKYSADPDADQAGQSSSRTRSTPRSTASRPRWSRPDALIPTVKKAVAAGIPVDAFNSGINYYQQAGSLTHFASDEKLGRPAGRQEGHGRRRHEDPVHHPAGRVGGAGGPLRRREGRVPEHREHPGQRRRRLRGHLGDPGQAGRGQVHQLDRHPRRAVGPGRDQGQAAAGGPPPRSARST